jgi:hypothetical protein
MQRFEQEARAAGALNHPNLDTVHDVDPRGRRLADAGALSLGSQLSVLSSAFSVSVPVSASLFF